MRKVVAALKISFLAVLAGWAGGMLLPILGALFNSLHGVNGGAVMNWGTGSIWLLVIGLFMGGIVSAVWIFGVFPLALFVPKKSRIWSPIVLTLLGCFAGVAIVVVGGIVRSYRLEKYNYLQVNDWNAYILGGIPFVMLAALVGGVTGFILSTLNRKT